MEGEDVFGEQEAARQKAGECMTQPQPSEDLILMPVDGSEMSEFAIPYAAEVAAALGAGTLITRVVERTNWSAASSGYLIAPDTYSRVIEQDERDAHAQTQRITEQLMARGLRARALVEDANSPVDLLGIAARERASLVVMATHARGGLSRATLGSVADQFVRHGHCPTLLVRARGRRPERPALARALVPLDGSAMSELAAPVVMRLAGRIVRQVTLLRVVDPDERSGAAAEAQRSLDAVRERIERDSELLRGNVETLLLWGMAAQQILEESTRHDLIVMATHGQTGATRWAFGSVADEVLQAARTPLLLTHSRLRVTP